MTDSVWNVYHEPLFNSIWIFMFDGYMWYGQMFLALSKGKGSEKVKPWPKWKNV